MTVARDAIYNRVSRRKLKHTFTSSAQTSLQDLVGKLYGIVAGWRRCAIKDAALEWGRGAYS
jgi:hypothetical protein